jgi:hypothetical protein
MICTSLSWVRIRRGNKVNEVTSALASVGSQTETDYRSQEKTRLAQEAGREDGTRKIGDWLRPTLCVGLAVVALGRGGQCNRYRYAKTTSQ